MHGICALTIVPLRAEAGDRSEMVSQLLFGDLYTVLENRKTWLRIKMEADGYEGWIDRKQHSLISTTDYNYLAKREKHFVHDTVSALEIAKQDGLQMLVQGSVLYPNESGEYWWPNTTLPYRGEVLKGTLPKKALVELAFAYLNTPYLWGGRSPFGIDCSGFTQIVYKMAGYALPRDAKDQALLGEALSFIDEAEPGDLAFFDNEEGRIVHVGIILANNYIIHASGKVRLDRLDQHGINNAQLRQHTHRLRVIKKIF